MRIFRLVCQVARGTGSEVCRLRLHLAAENYQVIKSMHNIIECHAWLHGAPFSTFSKFRGKFDPYPLFRASVMPNFSPERD